MLPLSRNFAVYCDMDALNASMGSSSGLDYLGSLKMEEVDEKWGRTGSQLLKMSQE